MKKTLLFTLFIITKSFICSSCSDDANNLKTKKKLEDFSINPKEVSLNYDKEKQFEIIFNGNLANNDFTWKISDSKRGQIDEKGLFKASKIGTLELNAISTEGIKLTSKITIVPYQNFLEPVIIDFTLTEEEVLKQEKRELLTKLPLNNGDLALMYKGENEKITNVSYVFSAKTKKLYMTGVYFTIETENNAILTYYKERYNVTKESKTELLLQTLDEKANIKLFYDPGYGSGWGVTYTSNL